MKNKNFNIQKVSSIYMSEVDPGDKWMSNQSVIIEKIVSSGYSQRTTINVDEPMLDLNKSGRNSKKSHAEPILVEDLSIIQLELKRILKISYTSERQKELRVCMDKIKDTLLYWLEVNIDLDQVLNDYYKQYWILWSTC